MTLERQLSHRDQDELDALRMRTEMLIRRIFGHNSFYLDSLIKIHFRPRVSPTTEELQDSTWRSSHQAIINLVNTMLEDG